MHLCQQNDGKLENKAVKLGPLLYPRPLFFQVTEQTHEADTARIAAPLIWWPVTEDTDKVGTFVQPLTEDTNKVGTFVHSVTEDTNKVGKSVQLVT